MATYMKIIYGITKSNFGGAQRYVFDMARAAKDSGHNVSVMCGGNGVLVEKLKSNNIRVISLPHMQRDISLIAEAKTFYFIFQTLMKERPDIFHTNSSKMGGLGNYAARLAGINKIIFTAHGWAFNEPRPFWQRLLIKYFSWLAIIFSHKTISVSEKTENDVSDLPFVKNKIEVIRNGIENFELLERREARRALGVHEEDTLVVGTLSELHPVKGLDILLDTWEKFLKKNDGLLVLVGEGEIRENLENYAESLGIKDKVIFKGYVDNARQYLSGLDIFCLPSRSEALPYTLLEAGLAAAPVIATSVGGVPEVIENGINGALVPKEDSETLFSTLLLFSQDKPLRERLGNALKETVKEKFSKEKMIEKTLALY
jgi:glycosyltransferase involved in cell wall biosynthesis